MERTTLSAGTLLGDRYQLVNAIGAGGMGEVHEALDMRLDRRVAVKLIRTGFSGPDTAERFRREARVLARIQHPNDVVVHDFGEHDGRPFIVMELLEGTNLQGLIDEGPLDPDLVRAVAAGMCAGLTAAHEAGVLHRDVKPSNVHLTRRGRVVLQDFGVAHLFVDDVSLTQTGFLVGTPLFMSTEAMVGNRLTPASDLYSLGMCMYSMLTGELPFRAESPHVVMYRAINEGVPTLRGLPGIPGDLADLTGELVARDPMARPSADDVLARLRCPAEAEALVAAAVTGELRERAVRGIAAPSETSQETARPVDSDAVGAASPDTDGRRPPEARIGLSGDTRRRILRAMTPETAASRLREAVTLVLRDDLDEAVEILTATSQVCAQSLGNEHPTTMAARYWLAVCLVRLGAGGEAISVFSAVSDTAAKVLSSRQDTPHRT